MFGQCTYITKQLISRPRHNAFYIFLSTFVIEISVSQRLKIMEKRKLRKICDIIKGTHPGRDLIRFSRNYLKRGLFHLFPTSIEMPWPTTISLELTNKCNLRCITCPREYDYGKAMKPGEMPTALAKRIVDQCYPYVQSMGLTGMGETLFAPNLKEVAAYIKSKKESIVIFISTNANFPDFIERIGPVLDYVDTVQISTDGLGETYENVRRGASFELLEKNIDALIPLARQHGVDVMFNLVITKLNYKTMGPLIDFAAKKGVRYVRFTYFNLTSVTAIGTEYYEFFNSPDFLATLDEARNAASRHKDVEVTGLDYPGNPGFKKCPLIWNHFQINYDGEVPPCCAKPFSKEYSFGNVNEMDVRTVLNSDAAKQFRAHLSTGTTPSFCAKCHFVNL